VDSSEQETEAEAAVRRMVEAATPRTGLVRPAVWVNVTLTRRAAIAQAWRMHSAGLQAANSLSVHLSHHVHHGSRIAGWCLHSPTAGLDTYSHIQRLIAAAIAGSGGWAPITICMGGRVAPASAASWRKRRIRSGQRGGSLAGRLGIQLAVRHPLRRGGDRRRRWMPQATSRIHPADRSDPSFANWQPRRRDPAAMQSIGAPAPDPALAARYQALDGTICIQALPSENEDTSCRSWISGGRDETVNG